MKSLSQADCDRMRRLCELHPLHVVAQLMHIHKDTVWRIRKRGFVSTRGGPPRRPMPDDFRIQMDKMAVHQLARHYNTGLCCIARWTREAGGRSFSPQPSARLVPQRVRPPREVVVAAVEQFGVTKAAKRLGVTASTLQKWREHYGLPIKRKRVIQLRKRPTARGWAERYYERQAA